MTPRPSTRPDPPAPQDSLFTGKKAPWAALYRRLVARLSAIPGLQLARGKTGITLVAGVGKRIGTLRVMVKGLEIVLSIKTRGTRHRVLLRDVREIDDELLSWIRAASLRARTAKRRSI